MSDPGTSIRLEVVLQPAEADALSELVKRLLRHNLGKSGLNLANPHDPTEADRMRAALLALERTLKNAGYDPR